MIDMANVQCQCWLSKTINLSSKNVCNELCGLKIEIETQTQQKSQIEHKVQKFLRTHTEKYETLSICVCVCVCVSVYVCV